MSPLPVAVAVLVVMASLATPGEAAAPRPVEFPPPELELTVAPVPVRVTRPSLELPEPAPLPAPTVDLGGAPLPRFLSTVAKPVPAVRDPGGFSCAFVAFRRAATLAECGVHRMRQGDVRGAREALEESLAIDARGAHAATAQTWLGEIALMEGRYDQAERRYRTALALSLPDDLAMHAALGLAWVALRRGDVAEAQRAVAQALAYVPPQPVALVGRFVDGVAQVLAGRPSEALALWDGLASSGAPAQMVEELPFWRGVALARIGEPNRALQELDRFVAAVPATHPLRLDAIVQAGWVALERGAPDEAERRFLLAESASPRPELRPQLRTGLVRAYLALGDTPRASEVARRVAVESPRDPLVAAALLLIADAAVRRGATAEALAVYRQLLSLPLPPTMADYVTYRLGEGLEREGSLGEAKAQYQTLRDKGRDEAIAQRAAYRLGLLALRDRDPAAARREGEAILRAGPVQELREPVLLLAGEGAARGGDPNRAAHLYRLALREYPESPRAAQTRLALGWALLEDGESETALREWQEVSRSADVETGTLASLASVDVLLRQGREQEALSAFRGLKTLSPADPLADASFLNQGILSVRNRAYQDAVQVLEPLGPRITDFPRQALLRRALGIARYHLGQYDAAERQFRQAAHVAPAEPSSWLGAGLAALAQNRLVEAEEALNRARLGAVAEVGAPAAYGLVLVAIRRADGEAFRERATSFVDRYPGHASTPVLLYGLVAAALDRGELEQAEGWVNRLVRDQPNSEYVNEALVRLAAAAEARPALALRAYRALLARRPTAELRAEAWLGLAEAALTLGDGADAQQGVTGFLQDASPADPRAPRAQALLVRAHQLQGQRDRALQATEAFLSRFPADPLAPSIQLARGQFLVEERRWEVAQRAFEAARDRGDPSVAAAAHFWLGEVLRTREEHEAAIAAYLGATYLYPSSPWAARGLQGAAQSYLSRRMPREAAILLRKLVATPGVEPALAQWARQALVQLGPVSGADPGEALRKGGAPKP